MNFNDIALICRAGLEEDNHFLKCLYRSTREDLLHVGLPDAMLENLIDMQFRAQQVSYRKHFPDADISVIEREGDGIGCLITHNGANEIRLIYIALLPHERSKGIGRQLIQALQAAARQAKKPLALSVSTQNILAKRLYLAMGFQAVNDDGANLEMNWGDSVATYS